MFTGKPFRRCTQFSQDAGWAEGHESAVPNWRCCSGGPALPAGRPADRDSSARWQLSRGAACTSRDQSLNPSFRELSSRRGM